jgi:hypothetical protein
VEVMRRRRRDRRRRRRLVDLTTQGRKSCIFGVWWRIGEAIFACLYI